MTDNFECNIDTTCEENPNCCYKQLKRKKQECEEKQKTAQDAINKLCAEKSSLHNELDQLKAENDKLKQTLTEIKEIAEIEIECKTYEIEHDCFNGTRCKALNEHIDFMKQILRKTTEM